MPTKRRPSGCIGLMKVSVILMGRLRAAWADAVALSHQPGQWQCAMRRRGTDGTVPPAGTGRREGQTEVQMYFISRNSSMP